MSKKFKVIISVLVAMLLLTFSGTAVALAQDEPESDPWLASGGLLARVADILGITQEQLVDAFQQARQEMREECLATDNGTALLPRARFGEPWLEKRWQGTEKRQETGRWFRGNRNDNRPKLRWRIAEPAVSQPTIIVPESWSSQVIY